MPIERWTTAQVLALAPDTSSAKGAQKVSGAAKWPDAGLSEELLWGLCQGSGSRPYQVCIDLREPAYKCSCPSRKFPCKHALGLLLLWSAQDVGLRPAPGWVEDWRQTRAARAEKAATRRAESGPTDEAAARKRAEQRADRITAGMAELDRWLLDQISHGLAGAERSGYQPYETMAARLVDAQAPGAANAVRRLGRIAGIGEHWADRLLGEMALIRLLIAGRSRLDELTGELAATVRSRIGVPVPVQEVLAGPALRDHWHVLGQVDFSDDRLLTRRTWLHGAASQRFALLLSLAAPGQALPADLVPGTVLDADLCWYPGALPLRAALARRHGIVTPAGTPDGAVPIRRALAGWTAALAADPWCAQMPMLLAEVVPTGDGHLVDSTGDDLPLHHGHSRPWWLLAAAGGEPVTVAGEYGPGGFRPLAAWPRGRYVPAVPDGDEGPPRTPSFSAELLSTALVGTLRRPFTGRAVQVGGRSLGTAGPGDPAGGGEPSAVAEGTGDAAALLESAAVTLIYQRAGVTPGTGRTPVDPAPPESAPMLPAAAAHRLELLLTDGGVPGGGEVAQSLLGQWLEAAAEQGYRLPAESLPRLLDAARRRAALRPALAVTAGRRGSWLAARHADWQYLLTESTAQADPGDWETGTPGQRLAYLTELRATDPAAGLALLTGCFDAESPQDRARFLGTLGTGLSPADEPLLERALDDRRKEVRQVAVGLLEKLPGSALGRRMTERALGCVRLDRDELVVTPPAECDAALRRDGVPPKPPQGIGVGAWLLGEIIARTPLAVWSETFGRGPAALLALPVRDDWAPVLHRGLARAAVVRCDQAWAGALISRMDGPAGRKQKLIDEALAGQLLEVLPATEFAHHVAAALRRDPKQAHRLPQLRSGPWPGELTDAVLETIEVLARDDLHSWHIGELCRVAATAMPVDRAAQADQLAIRLLNSGGQSRPAMAVAQLAAVLTFRKQMHEELQCR